MLPEEEYSKLLRFIIPIKARIGSITQWSHRFDDLPSFTTLDDGIAFEQVEGENLEPGEALLEIKKGFKLFTRGNSTIYALRGIDLQVQEGEFLIIKGPSGSGKTTLLNLLAGLDEPGRGAVFYNKQDLNGLSDGKLTKLRRKNFSYIFQNDALIPHLNAVENVKLPLELNGLSGKLSTRIQELLEGVGLGEHGDHKPAELSGGQMQRLGIARALAHQPKIIFADEPTGALDRKTTLQVMELLKQYHEETGVTIVLVTHDPEVARYGTRTINLEDGQIQ
ncbi:MAG: ABC transporter ATP-binding protein [Candidatus Heimdallarchaeota archaeon]|nr:ABC transporter ATP-binding protein [Candidatus Heimdallarchaeota archaeon]